MVRPKEVSCKRSFFFPFPPTYAERKKAIYPVVSCDSTFVLFSGSRRSSGQGEGGMEQGE